MTYPKYFHSNMAGAPVLSGTAGALIAVLDACLTTGFGSVVMDSLVIAGGIGTLTKSGGTTFERDAIISLSGITGGAAPLNGDRRILSITASTATFDATGVSDQTATGTITAKMSGLGWTKAFSGTNLAAYKASDVTAFGMYLRVDDTGTLVSRVAGYEAMSDINTGQGKFPTEVQLSGGGYWDKSSAANTTARAWMIFGDEKFFYFWCGPNTASTITSQGILRGFGDIIPRNSADLFACLLNSCNASVGTTTGGAIAVMGLDRSDTGAFGTTFAGVSWPRAATGLGSSVFGGTYSQSRRFCGSTSYVSGTLGQFASPYPNTVDNGLDLERVYAYEYDNSSRGRLPGLLHSVQNLSTTMPFSTFDRLDGQGDLLGKRLIAVRCGSPGYTVQNTINGTPACVFFDLTGPWR